MIFVLARDDGGLKVYDTEAAAIAACEGIDVEDGNYLFWGSNGQPLVAEFLRPNSRGRFAVVSGDYRLVPAPGLSGLLDALDRVEYLEGGGTFTSLYDVANHLKRLKKDG